MFRIRLCSLPGTSLILASFLVAGVAVGGPIFSPTLEEMKCRKITDTEERALCYALIRKKERQLQQAERAQVGIEDDETKVDFADDQTDWRINRCLRIYDPEKRDICFRRFREEQRKKQEQAERREHQQQEAKQERHERLRRQQAAPLTIKKCEDLDEHRERIVCYAEFHQEQLQKRREANQRSLSQRDTSARQPGPIYSPTLARMKCRKLSDRDERNQCLQDLYFSEREREREERQQAIEEFDLDEELRECYAIRDDDQRDECLEDVEDLAREVFEQEDFEYDDWLNQNRR